MKRFGVGLIDDHDTETILKANLPGCDYERLINYKNTATQIIDDYPSRRNSQKPQLNTAHSHAAALRTEGVYQV